MANTTSEQIGYIAPHPQRPDHLAIFRPDGRLSNTFRADETRDEVVAFLVASGFCVHDDGTVWACGL